MGRQIINPETSGRFRIEEMDPPGRWAVLMYEGLAHWVTVGQNLDRAQADAVCRALAALESRRVNAKFRDDNSHLDRLGLPRRTRSKDGAR